VVQVVVALEESKFHMWELNAASFVAAPNSLLVFPSLEPSLSHGLHIQILALLHTAMKNSGLL
jgi:hypothetical protein